MSLIRCPECGKEISDKSTICIGCGFPIQEYVKENKCAEMQEISCPYCSEIIPSDSDYCDFCGMRLKDYVSEKTNDNAKENSFNGIYKYSIFTGKQEVYCPRCGSSNCSHYQEQRIVPAKTKTRYTANLNPLRPFTLINKKERIVKKSQNITESKFICNSCGKIFL